MEGRGTHAAKKERGGDESREQCKLERSDYSSPMRWNFNFLPPSLPRVYSAFYFALLFLASFIEFSVEKERRWTLFGVAFLFLLLCIHVEKFGSKNGFNSHLSKLEKDARFFFSLLKEKERNLVSFIISLRGKTKLLKRSSIVSPDKAKLLGTGMKEWECWVVEQDYSKSTSKSGDFINRQGLS